MWFDQNGVSHIEDRGADSSTLFDDALRVRIFQLSPDQREDVAQQLEIAFVQVIMEVSEEFEARCERIGNEAIALEESDFVEVSLGDETIYFDRPAQADVARLLLDQTREQPFRWRLDAVKAAADAIARMSPEMP